MGFAAPYQLQLTGFLILLTLWMDAEGYANRVSRLIIFFM